MNVNMAAFVRKNLLRVVGSSSMHEPRCWLLWRGGQLEGPSQMGELRMCGRAARRAIKAESLRTGRQQKVCGDILSNVSAVYGFHWGLLWMTSCRRSGEET